MQNKMYTVRLHVTLLVQAVVAYMPDQIRDLMHLRQLFYSKVGQLCRERKALLRRMADEQDVGANIGLDDVSVRLSEVSDLAEQLRANGADEYRTYMQFSSAFSRGVGSATLHSSHASVAAWLPSSRHSKAQMGSAQSWTIFI